MWMVSIGLNVADRARILGHSTAVNLDRYTVTSDSWIEDTIMKVSVTQNSNLVTQDSELVTQSPENSKGLKPA